MHQVQKQANISSSERSWRRTKELVALEDGYRESAESWAELLRGLQRRGLEAPVVTVGDGGLAYGSASPRKPTVALWSSSASSFAASARISSTTSRTCWPVESPSGWRWISWTEPNGRERPRRHDTRSVSSSI